MKFLFKVILMITTMVMALNATLAMADDAAKSAETAKSADAVATLSTDKFKNYNNQAAYALGVSLGRYMGNSLKEQEKLGIKLDKDQLIAGLQDVFANKSQLSDVDIEKTLQSFEARLKNVAQAKMEQEVKENETKGVKYRDTFAKEKGVKKTETGLLYQVEQLGIGAIPKDSDTVIVNYKGTLTDATEFDNSYIRGEPLSFRLDGVIPGWTEGLKHIKKGGKIKLVIPPALAYGKTGVPGIPPNSTLVFDIELLDVKAAAKAEVKAMKQANKPVSNSM